jgi:hypothetical protein
MEMIAPAIAMLLWLQLKHYVADYLLQPGWMFRAKGDLTKPGGYIHAGVHAAGSLPAFIFAGLAPATVATFAAAEFVVHYAIDYGKAQLSRKSPNGPDTHAFWALHGADQLLHQLTYLALVVAAEAMLRAG